MLGRYGPCEMSDLQERMKRAVALLGEEEVKKIMREEGKIEVNLWVSRLAVSGMFALRFACLLLPCTCNSHASAAYFHASAKYFSLACRLT